LKHSKNDTFETSLVELETLVERMERGDLALEEALAQFERGITLIKSCQLALSAAEHKVQQLTSTGNAESLTDFDSERIAASNEP